MPHHITDSSLARFADTELYLAQRADIKSHLSSCNGCATRLDELLLLIRRIRSAGKDAPVPMDLEARIRAKLR